VLVNNAAGTFVAANEDLLRGRDCPLYRRAYRRSRSVYRSVYNGAIVYSSGFAELGTKEATAAQEAVARLARSPASA
jgi:hypothetical protein